MIDYIQILNNAPEFIKPYLNWLLLFIVPLGAWIAWKYRKPILGVLMSGFIFNNILDDE